jgi:hypothetical protein
MQTDLSLSIGDYISKEFPNLRSSHKFEILCHSISIDTKLSLKDLLEEWNYNDGFCYLKVAFI